MGSGIWGIRVVVLWWWGGRRRSSLWRGRRFRGGSFFAFVSGDVASLVDGVDGVVVVLRPGLESRGEAFSGDIQPARGS